MTKKKSFSLTHLTREGHAHMVDVGPKDVTARRAVARARVRMARETFVKLDAALRAEREKTRGVAVPPSSLEPPSPE